MEKLESETRINLQSDPSQIRKTGQGVKSGNNIKFRLIVLEGLKADTTQSFHAVSDRFRSVLFSIVSGTT